MLLALVTYIGLIWRSREARHKLLDKAKLANPFTHMHTLLFPLQPLSDPDRAATNSLIYAPQRWEERLFYIAFLFSCCQRWCPLHSWQGTERSGGGVCVILTGLDWPKQVRLFPGTEFMRTAARWRRAGFRAQIPEITGKRTEESSRIRKA